MTVTEALAEKVERRINYEAQDLCVSIGFISPNKPGWALWFPEDKLSEASWSRMSTGVLACSPEFAKEFDLVTKPTVEELEWDNFSIYEIDWNDF